MDAFVPFAAIAASSLFILSLMWMSHPTTARRGVMAGQLGMALAIVGALVHHDVVDYDLIIIAMIAGTAVGVPMALLMPMTAIPQRTAISHAFGALAVGLIGAAEYYKHAHAEYAGTFVLWALMFEMILGFLTCTASVVAFGKLQELLPSKAIVFRGQRIVNAAVALGAVVIASMLALDPTQTWLFPLFVILVLLFGVLLVIPIGGADMPTVIALLNSYAGLAASAMGFALGNKLLIVAGALDGASGFILAVIMCKAMNRSFANVMFGGFGAVAAGAVGGKDDRVVRSASAEEAAMQLENAASVVVIPGYGMAVAQAQHKVSELYQALSKKGVDVKFAIHPVAGRMPGHMNVLLAEANVPYEQLVELDDINPEMPQIDVALIIGANDTINPAARDDPSSGIAGMPIIEADRARSVFVIKRSMSAGFAGVDNPIYYNANTQMLFGDAKEMVGAIAKELQGGGGGFH
ncbi:MAG: NAD(P)(+) transhydrogenase (Re/Si-specific) subunit beta [Sphingobium sp.]